MEIQRSGDRDVAVIDGQRYELSVSGDGGVMTRAEGATTHHHVILDGLRRPKHVGVDGHALEVSVSTEQEAALDQALSRRGGGAGAGAVTSPMPGRVVRALVAEGAEVEAGAPVIIVEAMKMENELQAPVAGRVEAIHVSAGDTVDAGALLCTISEDHDASS